MWTEVPSHTDMGYPLVEAAADGSFVLTKHPGTGGLVSRRTAIEQVLYEIGDPRAYASPDVVADFTSFEISDDGQNRVRVEGARGGPPTDKLKVSVTFEDGFKCVAMVVVSGPQAVAKARKFAEIFWQRLDGPFTETRTELIGHSACWGESASPPVEPNEVVLRLGARAETQKPLLAAARAVAGIALGGPPGICGAGSRPQVSPAYGFWPALVDRRLVVGRMFMDGSSQQFPCGDAPTVAFKPGQAAEPGSDAPDDRRAEDRRVRVPLSRIAHSRSGDKADTCNLGVAALRPEFYPELLREVTAERVAAWFSSLAKGPVTRYRLDNLCAVNFVMQRSLGGGGTVSLQLDSQGKTFAQGILAMEVEIAAELADSL